MAAEMKFSFTYPYILYSSALAIKAKIMVELGTGTGMSTEALTEVAKITDGHILKDGFEKWLNKKRESESYPNSDCKTCYGWHYY